MDDRPTPVHNFFGELFGLPRRFAFIGYALVWSAAQSYLAIGRTATVLEWLAHVPVSQIATRPALVVTAAWAAFTAG